MEKVFIVMFFDGISPNEEIQGVYATKELAEKFISTSSLQHCLFIDEHVVIQG